MTALDSKQVLLDCRWLGLGGAGRATELLLRGLTELAPSGRWTLWGPDAVRQFLWDGARHERSGGAPKALAGQRSLAAVPPNDVAIYMHQIRPLRPGASVTLVHDTIPLRYGGSKATRVTKRLFYRAVASLSTRILTVSEHSRTTIERDLGVTGETVTVVRYPVDDGLVARVRGLREELPSSNVVLYVGSFSPHKNLRRLLQAFARTDFRRRGGTLLLLGGDRSAVSELEGFAREQGIGPVQIEGPCSQARLEQLYASSRLLVLPSLEEGFGLPVWEALCCGLPVCVSDAGSLPEITDGRARTFSPTSVAELAEALDAVAGGATEVPPPAGAPTVAEFANHFVDAAAAASRQ